MNYIHISSILLNLQWNLPCSLWRWYFLLFCNISGASTLHYVVNIHNLLKCVMRYPKRNKFLIFVSECFRNLLEMKKLCLILSSQQDLWELTTSSPPKHTKMLTVTSETSKSEKSKFLINAWIFFKLACEDSPYWILFMNGIWLDLPLGNIMKIRKNDVKFWFSP